MGSECLTGREFLFGQILKFWKWIVVRLYDTANILNDTALYT